MSMTKGIVARLREGCVINRDFNLCDVDEAATDTLMAKAADEIDRLTRERDEAFQKYVDANEARIDAEAKVAKLREALKPFAEAASMTADGFPDHDIMPMRLGQCRDARTALQETE